MCWLRANIFTPVGETCLSYGQLSRSSHLVNNSLNNSDTDFRENSKDGLVTDIRLLVGGRTDVVPMCSVLFFFLRKYRLKHKLARPCLHCSKKMQICVPHCYCSSNIGRISSPKIWYSIFVNTFDYARFYDAAYRVSVYTCGTTGMMDEWWIKIIWNEGAVSQ